MILVVYYSLSGKTAAVAGKIAELLKAEILVIKDVRPRRGILGFLRSGYQAMRKRLPAITYSPMELTAEQLSAFEGVVLLSPLWAGLISSPMRTFLNHCQAGIRRYALFLVCGDPARKYEEAVTEARALCQGTCLLSDTLHDGPNLLDQAEKAGRDLQAVFNI
jgi:hypothetical protein